MGPSTSGSSRGGRCTGAGRTPPPPLPRTKWTRRVPHPVLIGHAASLSYTSASGRASEGWWDKDKPAKEKPAPIPEPEAKHRAPAAGEGSGAAGPKRQNAGGERQGGEAAGYAPWPCRGAGAAALRETGEVQRAAPRKRSWSHSFSRRGALYSQLRLWAAGAGRIRRGRRWSEGEGALSQTPEPIRGAKDRSQHPPPVLIGHVSSFTPY